jgi:endonuclease/exonuclease/phosphatase family metal-dependent hydrolase
VAYNVEFGKNATAEEIGEALQFYQPDIVAFNEVPGGDWTARVGKVLDLPHVYVGKISSANHQDKYKSILSRTPLENKQEHKLKGIDWNPASAVSAVTTIDGKRIAVYSLHVSGAYGDGSDPVKRHTGYLVDQVLAKDDTDHIIVAGDFNDRLGEPVMNYCEQAGYRSMWTDLKIDVTRDSALSTWNALTDERAGVIDHILYKSRSPMSVVAGGIADRGKPLSDHHPVWAEIEMER